MIELVGFDGDDTLWHSEGYYHEAHAAFERIVGRYVDLADARSHERLLAIQRDNLATFGYGAKGMTLSMIEAAIEISGGRIDAADVQQLVALGKQVLAHPVELLPGVREAVTAVAARHRVVLITKGDLLHQERKVACSGLADLFQRIEIVSEKDPATYLRVLRECAVAPAQFVMIGNSLRSDIAPVVRLGGWGVHLPYPLLWAHERETDFDARHARMIEAADASGIPAAIETLRQRAAA